MEPTAGDILTNPGVQLGTMLVAALVLSYAATFWLSRIFHGKTYRYLIAPGVIVHEYSHALGCVLTGARVREIRVFDARGGEVIHEEPRLAFGSAIISMAPIIGASIAVYLLARLLVPGFVGFGDLNLSSWQFLLFAYLSASITAAMAPSRQDLKVGAASFVMLCLVIGLLSLSEGVSAYVGFLAGDGFERILGLVQFSLVVLAAVTLSAGVAYLILHRTTRQGTQYDRFE